MLPFRLATVTAAAALCLWSLFALLDHLNEPGILRSERTAVVKGCERLDNAITQRQCPPLLCQKALIDHRVLPLHTNVRLVELKTSAQERLVVLALASPPSSATPDTNDHLVCALQDTQVVLARSTNRDEIAWLSDLEDAWLSELSATMTE